MPSSKLSATAPAFACPKACADHTHAQEYHQSLQPSFEDEQAVIELLASPSPRTSTLPTGLVSPHSAKQAAQALERLETASLPSIWSHHSASASTGSFDTSASPVTPCSSPIISPASSRYPSASWGIPPIAHTALSDQRHSYGTSNPSRLGGGAKSLSTPSLLPDVNSSPPSRRAFARTSRSSIDQLPNFPTQHHAIHSSPTPAPPQRVLPSQAAPYGVGVLPKPRSFFSAFSRSAAWQPIRPVLPERLGAHEAPNFISQERLVSSSRSSFDAAAQRTSLSGLLESPFPDSSPSDISEAPGSIVARPRRETLYKTELCRGWEERGRCEYGEKCQFAHGPSELRNITRHPKWKTELCRTYWSEGSCPYAKRCCFIHELHEQRTGSASLTLEMNRPPLLARVRGSQDEACHYLPHSGPTSSLMAERDTKSFDLDLLGGLNSSAASASSSIKFTNPFNGADRRANASGDIIGQRPASPKTIIPPLPRKKA